MDGISSVKKRKGRKRNNRFRKQFQVDVDKSKELDHAGTLELEHVLGLTVFSNSALTSDPLSGLVAYPAGCVLVLLDCVKYKQLGTLHTPRRSITAAKFSPDGRYVLTGESGLHPAVRVWELSSMSEVATLRGHSVGIISVSFSPRMREIIVVGDAQDMMISVWSWPSKIMKTLNKFADEIYAMAVAEDSSFFTTVGNRHVKFYYLDNLRTLPPHVGNNCPIPLPTRCGILDNLKENCFCDVVCGRGCSSLYIFVVSMSGILCQINRDRYLERWVNVNMANACCLAADENCIFVGGTQGVVRMFRALDLQIITTLPRPHILGLDISQVTASYIEDISEDVSSTLDEDSKEREAPNQYPTARAITYDSCHEILTVVYGDRSTYIWSRRKQDIDGSDMYYFSKKYSAMYHRGCVWGLTTYPAVLDSDPEEAALGGALPPGALISVSADGTLRAWDVCANICEESVLKRNCVSAECLKIVYADKVEMVKKLRQQNKPREGSFVRHGKQSFSAVAVCPDGLHIATGNQHGRVCIYDTNTMNVMTTMLAHESEVTALGYSITKRYKVLASGSRDRMIHVMDASHGYQLLTTLDDHSSTITAINFTYIARCILMITSSLDMSVLIRAYLDSNVFSFKPVRAIVEKKSVVDFAINQWSGLIAMACQDRFVRVYSIISSVENTTYRGCPSHGGQLVKIEVDPSGQYLLTACSNRTINLLQFNTGNILNTFYGHAESITGIKFSHNMKHIISSAIDGCIFLWRLPESVTYTVKREMAEMGKLTRGMVLGERWKKSRLATNVLSVDVRSEPELHLKRESSPDLKVDLSLCNMNDHNYRARSAENRVPLEAHAAENVDGNVIKRMVDKNSNLWTRTSSDVSVALPPPRDDVTNNKMWDRQGQNNQAVHTYGSNHIPSNSLSPTSEAWLSACYERRRIFKLEARSIKKILAMMRLVTDAMEKDLAGNSWLMYSSSKLGTNNHLSHAYCGPDGVSRRTGMVVPASQRPLHQQPPQPQQHHQSQPQQHHQPERSSSAHRSVQSATHLPNLAGQEHPQQQIAPSKWKTGQDSKESGCKFSQQQFRKSEQTSSKLPPVSTSELSFCNTQSQSQVAKTEWAADCEKGSGHSLCTGIKSLFSGQHQQSDDCCQKQQPQTYHHTRIPIRIGSGLLKRISRSSKGLAVEASADNSINEGSSDTPGYLSAGQNYNHPPLTCTSSGEPKNSLEGHSVSSESVLCESSLHCCHINADVHLKDCYNDNGNKLDNYEEQKGTMCCETTADNSCDKKGEEILVSDVSVVEPADEVGEMSMAVDIDCCVGTDIDNIEFVTNSSDCALQCGVSDSHDGPVVETEDNGKDKKFKTAVELTNSFEDFFNSVAMFEAISDDLPSLCELVDDDDNVDYNDEIIFEKIDVGKNFGDSFGASQDCIITELGSTTVNECTRLRFSSSAEVLCGEAGVLIENKERCFGSGDGHKAIEAKHKDIFLQSCAIDGAHFSLSKSVICNKAQGVVPELADSIIKSPLVILDKALGDVE
ncbi:hypothetical protein BsWGS_26537 [Bradybaena similaris]